MCFSHFKKVLIPSSCLLSTPEDRKKSTRKKDFWLLNFAGARGAVSIALLLLLPDSFVYKDLFISLAFVMILFSLVVYPIVMQYILKKYS